MSFDLPSSPLLVLLSGGTVHENVCCLCSAGVPQVIFCCVQPLLWTHFLCHICRVGMFVKIAETLLPLGFWSFTVTSNGRFLLPCSCAIYFFIFISWAILRILYLVNNTWKTFGLTEICSVDVQIILDRLPTIGVFLVGYSFVILKVHRCSEVLIDSIWCIWKSIKHIFQNWGVLGNACITSFSGW